MNREKWGNIFLALFIAGWVIAAILVLLASLSMLKTL